jgi:hypothetical protein
MPAAATATSNTQGATASGHSMSQSRPDLLVTKSGTPTSTNNETHGDGDSGTGRTPLTMRLSDARLRRRKTKLIYSNRLSPWLTEDAAPRSLEPIVRRATDVQRKWAEKIGTTPAAAPSVGQAAHRTRSHNRPYTARGKGFRFRRI